MNEYCDLSKLDIVNNLIIQVKSNEAVLDFKDKYVIITNMLLVLFVEANRLKILTSNKEMYKILSNLTDKYGGRVECIMT